MWDISDITAKDLQSICLSKYRELFDYFGKKIPISEKTFFKKWSEIWAKSMSSDTIALSF